MPAFVYDILVSPIFWGGVLVWLVIDIAAQSWGQSLLGRLNILASKPHIFKEDKDPQKAVPLYVHTHSAAVAFRDALHSPFDGAINMMKNGIDYLVLNSKDEGKPFLFVGYILSFILLVIYLYLDAIGVVIVLISQGLVSPNISEVLQRFQYVAIGGTLFALLVGFYVLAQITKSPSELSRWDKVQGPFKKIAKGITYILIFLGFFAVIFLALDLMLGLGWFADQTSIINALVDFSSVWLTRINSALASILLLEDGIMGLVLLISLVLSILWVLAVTLQYVMRTLGSILPFAFDISYRLILVILFVIWFLFTTPILLFVSFFQRISDEGTNDVNEDKRNANRDI
ncbi:MAG: hypothetical protein U0V02_20975 [Anaerolineales bacterium]